MAYSWTTIQNRLGLDRSLLSVQNHLYSVYHTFFECVRYTAEIETLGQNLRSLTQDIITGLSSEINRIKWRWNWRLLNSESMSYGLGQACSTRGLLEMVQPSSNACQWLKCSQISLQWGGLAYASFVESYTLGSPS